MRGLNALPLTLFACALLGAEAAHAQAVPSASLALEARAQSLYLSGRTHFHAGEYEAARGDFQSSLDTVDSPNTRMYLGRTLQRMGRLAEAFTMLDRASRDADARVTAEPRYTATRDSARAEADALAPTVARLTVQVDDAPDDATFTVNDHAVQRTGLGVTMAIDPGPVTVVARARGRIDARRELTLEPGQSETVTLSLPRAPEASHAAPSPEVATTRVVPLVLRATPAPAPRTSPLRVVGWVGLGVGAAALATGLGFGLVAWNQYGTLNGQNHNNGLIDTGLRDDGARNQTVANALFLAGGVTAAAGLVMWLVGGRAPRESQTQTQVVLSPSGVGLRGAF